MENDMANVRTIITLSEEDKQWLKSYSNLHHVSVAEAIRQGIRKLIEMELHENYRLLVQYHKVKLSTRITKDFQPQKYDFVEIPCTV